MEWKEIAERPGHNVKDVGVWNIWNIEPLDDINGLGRGKKRANAKQRVPCPLVFVNLESGVMMGSPAMVQADEKTLHKLALRLCRNESRLSPLSTR